MALIKTSTKEYSWVKYIHNRIKNKKNFLCAVVGPTGSGKSWAGLSIALMLDKNFDASRIKFGLPGIMELINSELNYPPGSVFFWDEFQIGGGAREWRSLANRLLNSLLSTFRHRQFILLITTPYSDFIDSQTRKLLHAEFELKKINYETKKAKIKPMLIQYNSRMRKFYYKYLRIKGKLGPSPINAWNVPSPPQDLIDKYEVLKTDFTRNLNLDIEAQLKSLNKSKERKELTDKQEQALKLMAKYNDIEKVGEGMDLSVKTAYFHLSQARKKGYEVDEFNQNDA